MIESPERVLRRHGLAARKPWGQHFLRDPSVHAAIVGAARLQPEDRVVEIGAGLGTLTAHLLQTGAEVWAIERDRDLCQVLRAELGEHPRFRLFEADAVRFDYASAVGSRPPKIVGNLPYHLTGPLLFRLLETHAVTGSWVVMIQKEVADRLCARPGSKTYGGITVGLSRVRDIVGIAHVPPGAFLPPPKVDSSVIRLDPRATPRGEVANEAGFLALVRAAFQRRRKTLLNALGALGSREQALAWCERAGVNPSLRPERLAPEEFAALQRAREADGMGGVAPARTHRREPEAAWNEDAAQADGEAEGVPWNEEADGEGEDA
jgi:16S rRNA (adenine1518-N6/adenine1519-N6)-dimethyltransferase